MTYADPFKIRIQKAVQAVLAGISPANGFKMDLSGPNRVWRGRTMFGEDDVLPMLAILEPSVAVDQIDSPDMTSGSTGIYTLLIQGFVDDDPQNPTDPAHILLADVKMALGRHFQAVRNDSSGDSSLFDMDHKVFKPQLGLGTVRPPDDISAKAYFWLHFRMSIAEDYLNPYS